MRKFTLFLSLMLMTLGGALAQQDAMFTKYMFNSLSFNPGFAGSPEYMSVRLLYRNQWWGIDGAPVTQTFSIHSPVSQRVGLGLNVLNDKIGATGSTSVDGSYAYRMPFGNGKLSIGLQTGFVNWRADWSVLNFKDPVEMDQSFQDQGPNYWLFNFGAGLFYYTKDYYIGLSVPRLFNNDLRRDIPEEVDVWARQYRHYYLTAGGAIPINGPALIFKPSILIKSVGLLGDFTPASSNPSRVGAPTEFDLDLSLLFYEALWVGASFRAAFEARQFGGDSSFDSADIWVAFYMMNGTRIGASYDYTLSKLREFAGGSFEIMLGYDFNYRAKKVNTPRYF